MDQPENENPVENNENETPKKQALLNIPHRAVISFSAEIMGLTPKGDLNGLPRGKMTHKVFSILGNNYQECADQLQTLIQLIESNTDEK